LTNRFYFRRLTQPLLLAMQTRHLEIQVLVLRPSSSSQQRDLLLREYKRMMAHTLLISRAML